MKKNLLIYTLLFLISCILIYTLTELFQKNKNLLKDVDSYRIYYRKIDESILEDMCNEDLVIVEGSSFNSTDVDYLRQNNTKTLGYLSLMEIGNWDDILIDKLSNSDYLTINGSRVKNNSEKNFIGALYEESYQAALLEILDERIMSKNMDGVFLDTVGWIDHYEDDLELYNKLKQGYSDFIEKVKEKYPSIIIVQNRGFSTYTDLSCNFIDGILWENFYSPYTNNDESRINRLEEFIKLSSEKNTKVFTISFGDEIDNQKLSEKLGWTHLQTDLEDRYSKWDFSK